jgi:hypothetical protein
MKDIALLIIAATLAGCMATGPKPEQLAAFHDLVKECRDKPGVHAAKALCITDSENQIMGGRRTSWRLK